MDNDTRGYGVIYLALYAGYSPQTQEEGYYLLMNSMFTDYNVDGVQSTLVSGTPFFSAEYAMFEYGTDTYATTLHQGQQDYWSLQCHSTGADEWSGLCHLVQGQWEAGTIESDGTDVIEAEWYDPANPKNANRWVLACQAEDADTANTILYRRLPEETTASDARPVPGDYATLYYGLMGAGDGYSSTTEASWEVTGADIYGGNSRTFQWSGAQSLSVATATAVIASTLF